MTDHSRTYDRIYYQQAPRCSHCSGRHSSHSTGIYDELRELDREFEALTPEQQRLVRLADKAKGTLDRLQFNADFATHNLRTAVSAARGSASSLLAAGRARREAWRDFQNAMK